MFRARLLLAIALLGLLALLQGGVALWVQRTAEQQVQRGRLSSDIMTGYVELSANKQRLRSLTSQQLMAAGDVDLPRARLLTEMREGLRRLHALSLELNALEDALGEAGRRAARQTSLDVLGRHLEELGRVLAAVRPLNAGADAAMAWAQLAAVFEQSQGLDLRRLLNAEIDAERQATGQSRRAADQALGTMRSVVTALSLTATLTAALLALHFMRRLKHPIDELTAGALALQHGELEHRIPERQLDEFAAVARSFNAMASELQQWRAREQADRARLEDMVAARTAELRQAHETLQALDLRRRRFFADVSHELRTPATAIRGEAEVALRGRDKSAAEYKEALSRIVSTVAQFAHVIEDLTLLARSEVESLGVRPEALDWRALIQLCCEQAEVAAGEQGQRLLWSPPPVLAGEAPLHADAQRLRQVLHILLDNARRYSRSGARTQLSARVEAGELIVEVQDQGIGIPADELPHVFERHFRGETARLHRSDGLGLGLSIAQAIVRAHGGGIEVQTQAGQGTRVCVRLPLHGTQERGNAAVDC